MKDIIESFGIPHSEVELIVVNGQSSDFSHLPADRDHVSVYPKFESIDITPELRVRLRALRDPKFVLDVHLGKLAAYLRMLGFDALYRSCYTDSELVRISSSDSRTLLTRDRELLKHGSTTHGYWLRETDSRRQTAEIIRRFDLARVIRPFTRCMACNEILRPVSKEQVRASLPAGTTDLYNEFSQCPDCDRVYWKGSHYRRMLRWIEDLARSEQGS